MIHFGLNDLKETPLKELANQLGVPNASTLTAVDAIREIKNKLAPQSALVFVPMLPGDSGRAWKTATGVSIISLCIALAAAAAAWLATVAAINKNTAEQREKEELAWQTTIVYKIIDDASKTESSGIPFSDISIKYVSEATSAEGIRLDRKKLQPTELRRILMDLLAEKLIYQTAEDRYVVIRSLLVPGGGDALVFGVNRATAGILQVLSSDPGRYSEKQLEPIVRERAKVSSEEYLIAVAQLLAGHAVTLDTDNKLWPAANPPPTTKTRK